MNKKVTIFIILTIVAVLALAGIVFINAKDKPSASSSTAQTSEETTAQANGNATSTQNPNTTTEQSAEKTYTLEEVATHNSAANCWTVIDGSVYDLTSYVGQHPGGSEIERACGVDGSSLFNSRTTSSGEEVGTGTPHSSVAHSQLESLLIGKLSN